MHTVVDGNLTINIYSAYGELYHCLKLILMKYFDILSPIFSDKHDHITDENIRR